MRPRIIDKEALKKNQLIAAGIGRKKGVPNKFNASIKDAILRALDELGGVAWLVELGKREPRSFAMLLARVLPMQMDVSTTAPLDIQIRLVNPYEKIVDIEEETPPEALPCADDGAD